RPARHALSQPTPPAERPRTLTVRDALSGKLIAQVATQGFSPDDAAFDPDGLRCVVWGREDPKPEPRSPLPKTAVLVVDATSGLAIAKALSLSTFTDPALAPGGEV